MPKVSEKAITKMPFLKLFFTNTNKKSAKEINGAAQVKNKGEKRPAFYF